MKKKEGLERSIRQSHETWSFQMFPLVAFLFLFLLRGNAMAGPPAGGPTPPPVVTVTTVTERDVNPPAEFVGRIEAVQSVDLRARVQGYLEEILFEEGAFVKAGDLLYVIEQAPYKAQVNVNKAKVAKAGATHTEAELYRKRVQAARSGAVSATDIDTAVSNESQARAALQEAEATLEQSELDLSYTTVEAPINGIIGRTAFTQGNFVGPNSGALARIVLMDPIRVVFSISENRLPEMQKKRLSTPIEELKDSRIIRLRLPNGEVYPVPGRPDFMDNQVDSATGTIAFRAVFDNPDDYLVPGQYVTVLLSMSKAKKMPAVPQAAVLEDREGRYVFVVDGENRVVQRRISTDAAMETYWAVEEGVVPGETVIVSGIQKVRPGQIVTPTPAKVR
ncbi:MAG: efflux RND transporter periplasmic adaptor subunit [Thermodesulfobacteriota bacterium]|nr:efflux RND transporter periplasmic adaptor subunit [Thermodesulfobacteriota bacterium]